MHESVHLLRLEIISQFPYLNKICLEIPIEGADLVGGEEQNGEENGQVEPHKKFQAKFLSIRQGNDQHRLQRVVILPTSTGITGGSQAKPLMNVDE